MVKGFSLSLQCGFPQVEGTSIVNLVQNVAPPSHFLGPHDQLPCVLIAYSCKRRTTIKECIRSLNKQKIGVLPKLSFVLHSFLHCRICDTRIMALMQDLGKCSAAGALLMLCFARNVAQSVWRAGSKTKHIDTPKLSDAPTFKSITGHALQQSYNGYFL